MIYAMVEQEKFEKFSYKAGISDLARVEAVYQNGGFYFDFKDESLRHLEPFRKYKILLNDCDLYNSYH